MPKLSRRASGAAFTLRPGESITFVLPVTPRTKKNSRVHAKVRGRTVPLPSDAYRRDMLNPILQGKASRAPWLLLFDYQSQCSILANLAQPLNCAAIFYRDANRGDAVGYYQGLADALESAGVLSNDKWIMQWDGSRLAKDAKRPRIEVTLTALVGE